MIPDSSRAVIRTRMRPTREIKPAGGSISHVRTTLPTSSESEPERMKSRRHAVRYNRFFQRADSTMKYVKRSVCGIVSKLTVSEVIVVGFKVACRDVGVDCSFVARGETIEQVMAIGGKHAKEVHGYTDAQLNSPELNAKVKAAVKQE